MKPEGYSTIFFLKSLFKTYIIMTTFMRGSRSTAKLPMKFFVNRFFLFIVRYALLHIVVPYF